MISSSIPAGKAFFVHAVDYLCDRAVFVRLPVILSYGLDRSENRFIEICPYGKMDSMVFTVVDDLGLIGRTVRSQGSDPFSLGNLSYPIPYKGKVSSCRSDVALSKFISQHETVFCNMSYYWHIALTTLIGHLGCLLLSFDTCGINVQGVAFDTIIFHSPFQQPSVYLCKAIETTIDTRLRSQSPKASDEGVLSKGKISRSASCVLIWRISSRLRPPPLSVKIRGKRYAEGWYSAPLPGLCRYLSTDDSNLIPTANSPNSAKSA